MLTLSGAGQPQNGGGVEERFIITVKTDNSGSSADNQFTIPWVGTYDVDWGDGNTETSVVDTQTHTYASAGTYDVKVTATTGKIEFRYVGDPLKLLDIKNWGTCQWTSLQNSFFGCTNITNISAIDTPDFSIMNNLKFSFYNCSNLISMDVSTWDVSNVIEAEVAFQSCVNLETLNGIENWTFQVLNINGLKSTFSNCRKFNSNIGGWTYVGPILSNVLNNCDMFNHSLANWDLTTVYFGSPNILPNATGISQANYDATLISWASQSLPSNKTLNMGGSQYSYEAAAARQTIIDTYNWTIIDGGQAASPEFVLKWETTTPNEEIQIGVGSGTFNYDIDWGDGTVETYTTDANISHTYATAGDHITKITGDFPHINMGDNGVSTDFKNKLYEILNWGNIAWDSLENAFFNCRSLDFYNSIDSPNLQNCTSLYRTFSLCTSLGNVNGYNIDLSSWNVSNVTTIGEFYTAYNESMNVDLSGWVINANTTFGRLVDRCNILDVTDWDVSSLTNFSNIFNQASNLQEIVGLNTWNVSNGVNFTSTFRRLYDLTSLGDLSSWSFAPNSNLTNMFFASIRDNMNQTTKNSILNLDVSNATNMDIMFNYSNATSWLNLSNWDVSGVSSFNGFLSNSTLTTGNYDETLISWAAQSLQSNVNISFGNSQYTLGGAAEAARNTLINTYNWTITDGGGIFVGLLDTYPNASAAYSLRDLASASVGSAVVRVRRSSDNTEQDFTATEITDGTLTTFTGANDGFVTTWYDQSGNGYDLIQNSALNQPKLVVNGVVNTYLSKPSILADGSDYLIESTNNRTAFSFAHNSSASLSYVSNLNGGIWFGTSSAAYGNTGNQGFEIGVNVFNAEVAVRNNGVMRVKDNIDNTEWNSGGIYYSEWDVSVVDVNSRSDNYKNNTSLTVSHNGSATSPIFEAASEKELAFFAKSYGTSYSNGNFSEMIIWQGLQTSNREGIYNDTNNYY